MVELGQSSSLGTNRSAALAFSQNLSFRGISAEKSFDCNETKAGGSESHLKVNLHFQGMIGQGHLFKNG